MFGFICQATCGVACVLTGNPLLGCAAIAGGLVWLLDAGDDE
jgi:hypothetical protein